MWIALIALNGNLFIVLSSRVQLARNTMPTYKLSEETKDCKSLEKHYSSFCNSLLVVFLTGLMGLVINQN